VVNVDTCPKTTARAGLGKMGADPVIFQNKMTGLVSQTTAFSYTLGLK